jgi:hypothetical protein
MTLSTAIIASEALVITVATVWSISMALASGSTKPIATTSSLTTVKTLTQMTRVSTVTTHTLLSGLRRR